MLASMLGTDVLWRNALVAVPLAVVVLAVCRLVKCRPATRHLLWLVVLGVLFVPAGVPRLTLPRIEAATPEPAVSRSAAPEAPLAVADPVTVLLRSTPSAGPVVRRDLLPLVSIDTASAALGSPAVVTEMVASAGVAEASAPRTVEVIAPVQTVSAPRAPSGPSPEPGLWGLWRAISPVAARLVHDYVIPRESPVVRVNPTESVSAATRARAPTGIAATRSTLAQAPAVGLERRVEEASGNRAPAAAASLRSSGSSTAAEPARGEIQKIPVKTMVLAAVRQWAVPVVERSRVWGQRLGLVFEEIASWPSLPSGLWIPGSIGLAIMAVVRIVRHRRLLRSTMAAPAAVTQMVADAARTLGLKRAPEVVLVGARVSPMIWCGRRARLVLPADLWSELDEVGQRAVIHHELAHLKRLDHWVCWIELVASAVYWWHPLVWFVRRRLREEADLCCDAWVTMTLPKARRAYAEALLETRRFISDSAAPRPVVGLGAISGRARHFARRLTMVMTQRMTPRPSVSGMILALTLGAAGVLTAPLLACPPEEGKDAKAKNQDSNTVTVYSAPQAAAGMAPRSPRAPRAALAPVPPVPPTAAAPSTAPVPPTPPASPADQAGGASTFEQHVYSSRPGQATQPAPQAWRVDPLQPAGARNGPADLEQRLQRLERRLDEMNQRMDRLMERLQRRSELPDAAPGVLAVNPTWLPGMAGLAQSGDEKTVVVLVGPGDKVQAFKVEHGKLDGLRAMLADSGQPMSVERHAGAGGQPLAALLGQQQRVAQAEMEAARAADQAAKRAQDRAAVAQREAMARAKRELAAAAASKARTRSAADRERNAQRIHERAEALSERADALSERLDQAVESADSMNGSAKDARMKAVENLRKELEALRKAAEKLNKQADDLSGRVESHDEESDENEEADASGAVDVAVPAPVEDPAVGFMPPMTINVDPIVIEPAEPAEPDEPAVADPAAPEPTPAPAPTPSNP
jgi:beta-lactamase regulating signal transducer with metallopeptidase domain